MQSEVRVALSLTTAQWCGALAVIALATVVLMLPADASARVRVGTNGPTLVVAEDEPASCTTNCINDIKIKTGPSGEIVIKEKSLPITSASGSCRLEGTLTARCTDVTAVFVRTGPSNDKVLFEASQNLAATLNGGPGNDDLRFGPLATGLHFARMEGELGDDILVGSVGADQIFGDNATVESATDGSDTLVGNGGDDQLRGGRGSDGYSGGPGKDTVSYSQRARDPNAGVFAGVVVDTADNLRQDGDTLDQVGRGRDQVDADVEVIEGTQRNDTMRGSEVANEFLGREGNDTFDGRGGDDLFIGQAGADILEGGPGTDTASYADDLHRNGVTVTIGGGAVSGTGAVGDTVPATTENVIGSAGPDLLVGDGGPNRLDGAAGDDIVMGVEGDDVLLGGPGADRFGRLAVTGRPFFGSEPGADVIDGGTDGASTDTMSYEGVAGPVTVTPDGQANDGSAGEGDKVVNIEDVTGTNAADTLTSSAGDGSSMAPDGSLVSLPGPTVLRGLAGNDTLTGGVGADRLQGGDGTDTMEGKDGVDIVDYTDHTTRTAIDLSDHRGGTDLNADRVPEEGDVFRDDLEGIDGGSGPDLIAGNTLPNQLFGGGGDDTIVGRPGNDVIDGGLGSDDVNGREGDDDIRVNDGVRDTVACGEPGIDTVTADLQDTIRPDCSGAGDRVTIAAVDQHPAVELPGLVGRTMAAGSRFGLRMRCPKAHPNAHCSGRVAIQVPRTDDAPLQFLSRSTYRISRGETAIVPMRLSKTGRRLLGKTPIAVEAVAGTTDPKGRGVNTTSTVFSLRRG